jgi:branched-chain amino acid transport system ATP-binding protein
MTELAIQTEAVAKLFGGLAAVDGVTLQVSRGERRLLIGPNGAGKTTLFHCITGKLRATRGSVRLFGREVSQKPEHRRAALGMGRTFQITNVFTELTLLENLVLAIVGRDRRKWALLRSVESYGDVREQALQSLQTVGLHERAQLTVREISYGERRQLELALALSMQPQVLFLDEPCAGLSPSERQRIAELIAALPRDITLVMIEHDMDVALRLADQVTVLHQGRVILEGTPDVVRRDTQVRDIYFGHV